MSFVALLATPGALYPILGSSWLYLSVQQRASKMIEGLEHLSCEGKVERPDMVPLGEEKAQKDLINMYK